MAKWYKVYKGIQETLFIGIGNKFWGAGTERAQIKYTQMGFLVTQYLKTIDSFFTTKKTLKHVANCSCSALLLDCLFWYVVCSTSLYILYVERTLCPGSLNSHRRQRECFQKSSKKIQKIDKIINILGFRATIN